MSIQNGQARQELGAAVLDSFKAADGPEYKHKNVKQRRARPPRGSLPDQPTVDCHGKVERADDNCLPEQFQPFYDGPKRKPKKPSKSFLIGSLLLGDEPPRVFVPAYICKHLGGDYAAIIASQLAYWNSLKGNSPRLVEDGEMERVWTPGLRGIFLQTGITKDKARRALQRLEKGKILDVERNEHKPSELRFTAPVEKLFCKAKMFASDKKGVPGVLVRATEVLITNNGNQAIVLANILKWFEPNEKGKVKLRVRRDDHLWRANSYPQLSQETGLSTHQVKRAITWLRDNCLLFTAHYLFSGKRVLHVRPNIEVLQQRLDAAIQKLSQRCPAKPHGVKRERK